MSKWSKFAFSPKHWKWPWKNKSMFLNNRHSIHFSDESHSKGIEEFVPKNSLGQKKFFWPMDKICLFTESSSICHPPAQQILTMNVWQSGLKNLNFGMSQERWLTDLSVSTITFALPSHYHSNMITFLFVKMKLIGSVLRK